MPSKPIIEAASSATPTAPEDGLPARDLPPPPPSMVIPLQRCDVLSVDGRDAGDFLQRQCMNDVRELATVGDWQWNGLLSAKGRVLALFALLRIAEQGYWLVLPDGDAVHWAGVLGGLVFRSKLTLAARPDLQAAGVIGDAALPGGALPSRAEFVDGTWWLDHGSAGRPRRLLVGVALPAAIKARLDEREEAAAAWTIENLRHGLPRIGADRRDSHTPQMLGLDRLAAFSVRKGCYPGQEIVARTHFLGQAKRRLARLVADRPFADGEAVRCGEQTAALFDHASFAGAFEALAVIASEPADAACLGTDGTPIRRSAFIDGLVRRPA